LGAAYAAKRREYYNKQTVKSYSDMISFGDDNNENNKDKGDDEEDYGHDDEQGNDDSNDNDNDDDDEAPATYDSKDSVSLGIIPPTAEYLISSNTIIPSSVSSEVEEDKVRTSANELYGEEEEKEKEVNESLMGEIKHSLLSLVIGSKATNAHHIHNTPELPSSHHHDASQSETVTYITRKPLLNQLTHHQREGHVDSMSQQEEEEEDDEKTSTSNQGVTDNDRVEIVFAALEPRAKNWSSGKGHSMKKKAPPVQHSSLDAAKLARYDKEDDSTTASIAGDNSDSSVKCKKKWDNWRKKMVCA
jgi:hypothetical protein